MTTKRRMRFCGSAEHFRIGRRGFLASAAGSALAADMSRLDVLAEPALAAELRRRGKHVVLLWLAGGASQLETWDPKPGRPTGGPFAAIETSVPGVHISELLPAMARRMERTCLVRSLNTRIGDHGGGTEMMLRGRRDEPNLKYPDLGATIARELGQVESQAPDYVSFYSSTEGRGNVLKAGPGFLGSRYAPIRLTEQSTPPDLRRLETVSEVDHADRAAMQAILNRHFSQGRESTALGALGSHATAYGRVRGLMASEKLFDISAEPQKVRDRYGPTQFGEQCLVARRLLEAGTPFVQVARAWWDSHGQNFETHLELASELDQVMSALIDDLRERGLLESTLIVTLGEFGRTPRINASLGRDHFASAWSASLTGCGVKGGAVYGKTDDNGERVVDGEIGAGELFATILEAVGIRHDKEYHVGARPIPLVNPGIHPIKEVLA